MLRCVNMFSVINIEEIKSSEREIMDLEYLLQMIKDGTVSIVNTTPTEPESICSIANPSQVTLNGTFTVVRLERQKLGDRYDYFICVCESEKK